MKVRTVVSLLLLAAMPLSAADKNTQASKKESEVLTDIHKTNQMEITMGQLAKERGSLEAVKNYGDRLVKDHTDADARTQELASQRNITLKPADQVLSKADHAKMQPLQGLNGADFDRQFARAMAADHKAAIEKLQTARGQLGETSPVSEFIAQLLPQLEEHQRIAQDLSTLLKNSAQR